MKNISPAKRFVFLCLFIFLNYLFLESACFLALEYFHYKGRAYYHPLFFKLSKHHRDTIQQLLENSNTVIMHSTELGWTMRPGSSKKDFHINHEGIRGNEETSLEPDPKKFRISAFGESFTQGAGGADKETWERQLERINPRLQVLNFGAGGYGLDQAFLRYRKDGPRFHPKIVFIGYMTENIHRNLGVFRPFYYYLSDLPLAKPRFALRNGRLELLPNPLPSLQDYRELLDHEKDVLPRIGLNDYHFQSNYTGLVNYLPSVKVFKTLDRELWNSLFHSDPILRHGVYNIHSEAFRVTGTIFENFHEEISKNGSTPVILVYPTFEDIKRYNRYHTKVYVPLLDTFKSKGWRFIDLMDAFEAFGAGHKLRDFFGPDFHYSALGNEIVAKFIDLYLREIK